MKIVGLKYTHDASVAVLQGQSLSLAVEMEKVDNRKRYTKMEERGWIKELPISWAKVDHIVVDGWKHNNANGIPVASYNELRTADILREQRFNPLLLAPGLVRPYSSFTHSTGHLVGGYAMSPFVGEDAALITWDGGQSCRAYLFRPKSMEFLPLGNLLPFSASLYGVMGLYFGPFADPEVIFGGNRRYAGYDIPGKLMSYIALGKVDADLLPKIKKEARGFAFGMGWRDNADIEHEFMREVRKLARDNISDASVLATIHQAIGEMIVEHSKRAFPAGLPLIFTGGAALNIKWNSMLRDCGHFADVFVPPVPNDTGSAIGAATAKLWTAHNRALPIEWSAYCGLTFIEDGTPEGWAWQPSSTRDVAKILVNDPVLCLRGTAEIGPRALGHRSILASPLKAKMKDRLNQIKKRETFRPVAPLCLEEFAPTAFDPGTPDPFMLFEHRVDEAFQYIIPAIVHLDGTARLQTVNDRQEPFLASLLREFEGLAGVPVLCNTSANELGSGFFDRLSNASHWADRVGIRYIVTDNGIYSKKG